MSNAAKWNRIHDLQTSLEYLYRDAENAYNDSQAECLWGRVTRAEAEIRNLKLSMGVDS